MINKIRENLDKITELARRDSKLESELIALEKRLETYKSELANLGVTKDTNPDKLPLEAILISLDGQETYIRETLLIQERSQVLKERYKVIRESLEILKSFKQDNLQEIIFKDFKLNLNNTL